MKYTPNVAIIRLPDDENGKRFAEVPIDDEGISAEEAIIFSPLHVDDSYHELNFSHIVLAYSNGQASLDLSRYEILDEETGELANVHDSGAVPEMIESVFEDYMSKLTEEKLQ